MTLGEARQNIGAAVVYTVPHSEKFEDGVITSANDRFVFVRYTGDTHAKATHPANLALLAETTR